MQDTTQCGSTPSIYLVGITSLGVNPQGSENPRFVPPLWSPLRNYLLGGPAVLLPCCILNMWFVGWKGFHFWTFHASGSVPGWYMVQGICRFKLQQPAGCPKKWSFCINSKCGFSLSRHPAEVSLKKVLKTQKNSSSQFKDCVFIYNKNWDTLMNSRFLLPVTHSPWTNPIPFPTFPSCSCQGPGFISPHGFYMHGFGGIESSQKKTHFLSQDT